MEHTHPHTHISSAICAPGESPYIPDEAPIYEEQLALLAYMIDHNRHHTEELYELAEQLPPEVESMIHLAVRDFHVGNEKLMEAFHLLKEGL